VHPLPAERIERVWGWGKTTSAWSAVYRPHTRDDVEEVFALARTRGWTIALRGAGQSYGDAALNSGGISLDLSHLNRILAWDPSRGVIQVEPGVTMHQLWQHVIGDGWWPPVVPGTMRATVGGCVAANVHGKNNWKAGPLGEHVLELDLLLPNGELKRCRRNEHGELFHGSIGGFGLLGCFSSATLQLRRVHSGLLSVRAMRVRNLDEMIATAELHLDDVDHLVGWVDGFARGPALGRGLVHTAKYLQPGEDPHPADTLRVPPQQALRPLYALLPDAAARYLLRPLARDTFVGLLNGAVFHLGRWHDRRALRQPHARFAFLFDSVPNWRDAYGKGGLIEYQSFIPRQRAATVFRAQLAMAQAHGLPPYAAAFKAHRSDSFLLSHGVDGYSLGLHFKVTPGRQGSLIALAAELDRLVCDAGGRLYFAKDSTTTPTVVRRLLGSDRLDRFLRLKSACDPDYILETDLFRRLLQPSRPEPAVPHAHPGLGSTPPQPD
jgi:decaprenylphospho-beta-D-ribofuranose 2-oxidase